MATGKSRSRTFWNEFEQYWFSIPKERICLSKKDIIIGIIIKSFPLLDHLLNIAKLVLAFKSNVELKNEAELYIARTGNKMKFFRRKVGDF